MKWLHRAVSNGIFNYPLLSEVDPFLANHRGLPQFPPLMAEVQEKWETFRDSLDFRPGTPD